MKKIIISLLLVILISSFVSSQETVVEGTAVEETVTEETPIECIGEGEKGSLFNDDTCCPGLKQIANSFSEGDTCLAPSDGSFICTNCGNGICGDKENNCNCPEDCKEEKECKAIFSHCSCSYQCMEIVSNDPIIDCEMVCTKEETSIDMPNCGYVNGACIEKEIPEEPKCPIEEVLCQVGTVPEGYIGEDGCEHKRCVPKECPEDCICDSQGNTIECEAKPEPTCPENCRCDSNGNIIKCEDDTSHVYLNQKFELKQSQSAKVVDYKNIQIKYVADSACECPTCPENAMCKPCACREGILLQVERPQDCEAITDPTQECVIEGTEFSINVGEAKPAFGAEIKLMNYYSGVATLLVTRGTIPPQGIYVRLNEKFSLSKGDAAKVTDYSYMKIILRGLSEGVAKVTVDMPPQCEETQACTGTATEFSLREGESREVFGAKLTLLGIATNMGTGKEHATFIVEKPASEGGVDIKIIPTQQTISYGEKASYKVIVTDKHAVLECPIGSECLPAPLIYRIHIKNLPFQKEYPKEITLSYGGSESFELVVRPYEVTEEEAVEVEEVSTTTVTGNAVANKVTNMVISKPIKQVQVSEAVVAETATSSASGGGGRAIAKREIKEEVIRIGPISNLMKRYKFSVTATLRDDYKVQDTASAVLVIKPKSPPPVPPTPPPFPGEKISIKLHKGWNLISLPGKLIKFDKEGLVKNQKLIGFVYIKEKQKYFSLKEAERILGDELREYLAKNAFWIHSRNPMTLNIWIDRKVSFEDLVLVKGWNLVPITEDMLGGYLTDVLGDCNLEKINLWNAKSQRWDKIDSGYSFSEYQLGYGFLIKSKDYCKLVGPEIIAPPPMPE